jgi:hypothetical protein
VFLPLLTGMAAMSGSSPQPTLNGAPLYPLPLAIHLLSVELLSLWLPFGKLAHAFLVFMARGVRGPLSRAGELRYDTAVRVMAQLPAAFAGAGLACGGGSPG